MDSRVVPLYLLSAVAGFVMIIGGMLLVYKEKIYIDKESKQVTEIETPIGKFRTNLPALVLFVLGFVPMFYTIHESKHFERTMTIVGSVRSSEPTATILLYAVEKPQAVVTPRDRWTSFSITVPRPAGDSLQQQMLFLVGNRVAASEDISSRQMKDGVISVGKVELQPGPLPPAYAPTDVAIPAEFARK